MLKEECKHIIDDFSLFTSWEEKYEHLISLGRELTPLKKTYKTDAYLIKGCQSRVWLACEYGDGKLFFYGDSDALITKGIVALIIKIYSLSSPSEIVENDINVFTDIGLDEHLSMTRANGLSSMLKAIKNYAIKYLEK
tara:strand:- start:749 stop:1162 length:414 start_codon:yes stop_codon:yes gene_type:complete